PSTSPRRSPSAWSAARPRITRSGWWRAASACWSARREPTRRAAATVSIRASGSRIEPSLVTVMLSSQSSLLPRLLFLLGIGFLAINVRLFVEFIHFRRLRPSALLIWPGRRPPLYTVFLGA